MRKRSIGLGALLFVWISTGLAQPAEDTLLTYFTGAWAGSYDIRFPNSRDFAHVGMFSNPVNISALEPNSISFSYDFSSEYPPSSIQGKLQVVLRHEPGTRSYLLDFEAGANGVPLSIQEMALSYSNTGELTGSGIASIADEDTPVEVTITIDRTKNMHEWKILIPNQPGVSTSEEPRYYNLFFARGFNSEEKE